MTDIQLNDIGTEINITIKQDGTPVNLSDATNILLYCSPPNNTGTKIFEASIKTDGVDGNIYYVTGSSDFDVIGTWEMQVYVYFGANIFHSNIWKVKVLRNVEA